MPDVLTDRSLNASLYMLARVVVTVNFEIDPEHMAFGAQLRRAVWGACALSETRDCIAERTDEAGSDAVHHRWTEAAAACLGVTLPQGRASHYIENCVPWHGAVARAMVERIEAVHGRPYHDVLLTFPSISEYFIYGLFADLLSQEPVLAPADRSVCKSFWPAGPEEAFDLDRQLVLMEPWHKALAVQLHPLPSPCLCASAPFVTRSPGWPGAGRVRRSRLPSTRARRSDDR